MDTKVHIEKLNNKNYFNWKYKIELLMIKEKVWYTICDDKPATPDNTWKAADGTARALIGVNVEDSQLQYVRQTCDAKTAWDALKKVHESGTLTNKCSLIRKMYDTKMQDGQSLEKHLETLNSTIQQLTDLGEKISNIHKVGVILSSLPSSWSTLVTALEVRKEADLSVEIVQSALLDEEIRKKRNMDSNEEKVLNVRFKKGQSKHYEKKNGESCGQQQKPQVFCYFCKKRNHIMRNCNKFKEYCDKNPDNNKANLLQEDETILSLRDESVLEIESNDQDDWILDSGATSHVSGNENYLIT